MHFEMQEVPYLLGFGRAARFRALAGSPARAMKPSSLRGEPQLAAPSKTAAARSCRLRRRGLRRRHDRAAAVLLGAASCGSPRRLEGFIARAGDPAKARKRAALPNPSK